MKLAGPMPEAEESWAPAQAYALSTVACGGNRPLTFDNGGLMDLRAIVDCHWRHHGPGLRMHQVKGDPIGNKWRIEGRSQAGR
jgi:hypothetical protein